MKTSYIVEIEPKSFSRGRRPKRKRCATRTRAEASKRRETRPGSNKDTTGLFF